MARHDDADELVEAAASLVGPVTLVADRSWPHGVSRVLEVRAAAGPLLIVKQPRSVDKFDNELHAYRYWAPALTPHVPELLAENRDARVLVFSKLPGKIGDLSTSTFRQADQLSRLLHDAQPPAHLVDFSVAYRDRFDTWARRARPGLLDTAEVEFVEGQLRRLADHAWSWLHQAMAGARDPI